MQLQSLKTPFQNGLVGNLMQDHTGFPSKEGEAHAQKNTGRESPERIGPYFLQKMEAYVHYLRVPTVSFSESLFV